MTWFTWRTNATRRKATASRGDNRPSRSTQRLVASPILSIFYDAPQPAGGAYRRARECEGGGGKVGVRPQGRTSAREVVGISNFTERGLTRPTRGGEKLGQPPCVTSLPAAKTDADVEHRRALSFPVHPFKRCHLGIPRTMGEWRGEGGGVPAHYLRWLPSPLRGVCHPVTLETHTFRDTTTLPQVSVSRARLEKVEMRVNLDAWLLWYILTRSEFDDYKLGMGI